MGQNEYMVNLVNLSDFHGSSLKHLMDAFEVQFFQGFIFTPYTKDTDNTADPENVFLDCVVLVHCH